MRGQRGVILEIHRSGKAWFDGAKLKGSSAKQRVADFDRRLSQSGASNVHIWVDKSQRMKTLLPYADAVPRPMGVALVTSGKKQLPIYGQLPWVDQWVKGMRRTGDAKRQQEKLLDGIVRAAKRVP